MALGVNARTAWTIAVQAGLPEDRASEVIGTLQPIATMDGAPYYDGTAVSRAVAFALGLRRQAELEAESAAASAAWRAVPGAGSGPMGMTADAVKFGPEYQAARKRYETATANLGAFNGRFLKLYARELKARRRSRRPASAVTQLAVD